MNPINGESSGEGGTSGSAGSAARIKALDQISASTIRSTQVITCVSDVVRELVENAIDAGGTTIQIVLMKYGLEKIQVRDNGHGIAAEDFQLVFQGGHTSKLKDIQNLSRGDYFGYKGEALRAMCASGDVSVLTKTASEAAARKYQLNAFGGVTKRSHGSHSGGTTVTLEKLFEGIRVRRQRLENKTTAGNELKEIEAYLKGVALANPKCHLSLFHNASLVWSKAAVQTMEQAIIAVLGHNIGRKIDKFGPIRVNTSGESKSTNNSSNPDTENGLDRSIELYLPKKPVDMRTMSYTSNKLAFIFCNQKRVFIREFEKLIHRYTTSSVVKPQPADQRRFPVSILCINVPPAEVDFNREMDKSKVFLVHKDKVYEALEEALIAFYEVDLRNCDEKTKSNPTTTMNELSNDMSFEVSLQPDLCTEKQTATVTSAAPILSSPSFERRDVIQSFLQDIPRSTKAFSASPSKGNTSNVNVESVSVVFPVSKPAVDTASTDQVNEQDSSEPKSPLGNISERRRSKQFPISNFVITVDSQELEDVLPPPQQNQSEGQKETIQTPGLTSPDLERGMETVSANKYQNWLEGRMTDRNGDVIRNVVVVNQPPIPRGNENEDCLAVSGVGIVAGPKPKTSCQAVYSTNPPPTKRQKLLEEVFPSRMSPAVPTMPIVPMTPVTRFPLVAQSTPDNSHKQMSLDSFPNWKSSSSSGGFSPATSGPMAEIRVQITPPQPNKESMPIPFLSSYQLNNQIPVHKPNNNWGKQLRDQSTSSVQELQPPLPPLDNQHLTIEQTDAASSHSRLNIDWQPCTDYCDNMTNYINYSLTPGIIGSIQGPSDVGPLYLVRTEDGIGVFSPQNANLGKQWPEKPSNVTHHHAQEGERADLLGNSDCDASTVLEEYLARQSIHNTPAEKALHTLLTSTKLAEIAKKCMLH